MHSLLCLLPPCLLYQVWLEGGVFSPVAGPFLVAQALNAGYDCFRSTIRSLFPSLSTSLLPPVVAENTPVQLYRRAACDSQGKDTLNALTQTGRALRNLEDEYNRGVRNPLLRPTFSRAQKDLDIIIFEIKDEVGDPIPERSTGPALDKAQEDFEQVSQQLRYGLESIPQLAQDLDGFMNLSRNVYTYIEDLIYCWKTAAGR